MANKKVPSDGHKQLNVQQSRFLSDIYDREDKYRSLMVKNGMNKFQKHGIHWYKVHGVTVKKSKIKNVAMVIIILEN